MENWKIEPIEAFFKEDCLFKGNNLFYSREWISLITEEYGFNFKAVVKEDTHPEDSLLIFAEVDDIFGKRLVSLPFSDYTEPFALDDLEIVSILSFLKEKYYDWTITFKFHGQLEELEKINYTNIRQAVCHRVNLRGSVDELWNRTSHAFKKGVKKAQRNQVRVEIINTDKGIEMFHRLLTNLRRKKFHILPQPKSFYLSFIKNFINKGQGNVWVAFMDDKPIASALILNNGSALFDKMGVSDEEYLEFRPNNLLLWEIMKSGNQQAFEYLDMGLSQINYTGLIRFKDSMGGVQTPINYYRYTPECYDIEREGKIKNLLSGVTGLLVRPEIPDEVVQEAGNLLYKYFC
ncbi:GNAT family N-acetyltransferase [Microcoleus sp. FACHB-68]|uniref:GNAT family N-acetyltransferase n=1 Tax=Microcoleus sp. FACHB-68 TaxID=2692826 RepID=UPI00168201DB|nr:GNAT family N-acetyltransferase [Microcoleus sp. FACHB-68]MBD1940408.1 GNAT family N-acetyltransferase [Microcoleus sp. FACHB-68]